MTRSFALVLAASALAPSTMTADTPAAVAPRTLRTLAQSTADKPAHVRVLFYGQSITKQDWWLEVADNLRRQFPTAQIDARNLAVGGFAAQRLVHTAARDLAESYPDLLIFHVYGSHGQYEDIIRLSRSLTTAEIVIQTDHFGAKGDPAKPDTGWPGFMNKRFLPAVAAHYGCAMVDVHELWRQHLLENKLAPEALLMDGVHLNEAGCHLMASLISRALKADPAANPAPADFWITDHPATPLLADDGKRLRLAFTGNRAEAFLRPGTNPAATRVLIDGQPPSRTPGCVIFSRPNAGPDIDWPWDVCGPVQITSRQNPEPEDWSITVSEGDASGFRFTVAGSKTGPDGEGSSKDLFVSKSGRIVIDPQHWWTQTAKGRPNPIVPGYTWKFRAYSLGTDDLAANATPAPGAPVALASNLAPGPHTLELVSDSTLPVEMISTFAPPLVEGSPAAPARIADRMDPNDKSGEAEKTHLRPIE